ncbi:MAG: NAD-dependent epimerase/dehydratase family protein [Methanoregula sp.]|nr:NAD-dependent epimerase/dehydratase family protein [Methanoregula sp.]
MTNKQAIVTGAYGFLGRHVAKVFSENGFSVTGIGHGTWLRNEWQNWGLSEWDPCTITIDNLSTYILQPDVIIHCAGSGSVGYSMTHPMQDYERTVSTTVTLLEFLRLHSPKTSFVYPSSAAVYGIAKKLPIAESAPLNPISPYGVHKKIVEEISQSYARHFSIPVAIARFFSLYGPGLRKQLLWDSCKKIENGAFNFYGTGNEVRDWLHVKDAAQLLLTLSSHASSDALVVNGGTGKGTTVHEIIEEVSRRMDKKNNLKFSNKTKPGDPPGYIADIKKATSLGWRPKFLLHDGIEEYVHWYSSGAP